MLTECHYFVQDARPNDRGLAYTNNVLRELDALPVRIETLEGEIARLHEAMARPDLYTGNGDAVARTQRELAQAEAALEECFARWAELEDTG
jgi:ATP-binding cassette subfamily F protein uup